MTAAAPSPLRLLVWDRTCRGAWWRPGLTHAWTAGDVLYRALGRLDAGLGAASWSEALTWLGTIAPERRIGEIQFWGHGRWGRALIDRAPLDGAALAPDHALAPLLDRVRDRLAGPGSLVWLRTCETFGGAAGHAFARALATRLGCRVAGHTHVIGIWQSGLHVLGPGQAPDWPEGEGHPLTPPGPPATAEPRGLPSRPWLPRTVSFLGGTVPELQRRPY